MYGPDLKLSLGVALGVGAFTISAVSFGLWYKRCLQNAPPKLWRRVGELTEIVYYPIKSCAPVKVTQAQCNQLGLEEGNLRDRVFMVATDDLKFVTARAYPKMLLIQPAINGDKITMSAPSMPDISLSFEHLKTLSPMKSSVWGMQVDTVDCGSEVATWMSQYILEKEFGMRLLFYPSDKSTRHFKAGNRKHDTLAPIDGGALHDASSYMLFNEASVADLNDHIEQPVTTTQFRPNLVVKGPDAFAEDTWDWIKIGQNVTFRNVKLCTRCIFTNIDPVTAERNKDHQPLKTLNEYRSIWPGESPCFGIHMGIRQNGIVTLGDEVYVGESSR